MHRLVVVDANTRVVGVLSLSDILKELVLKPSGECAEGVLKNNKELVVKPSGERRTGPEVVQTNISMNLSIMLRFQ